LEGTTTSAQDRNGKVDILVGAFMLMKRQLYRELGGFARTTLYSDDIDLSYGCCGRGDLTIILARQYYIIRAESTIRDGVYETLSGGHEFFYEKSQGSLPSFNRYENGNAFFISVKKC
jgi:hypothetical protein